MKFSSFLFISFLLLFSESAFSGTLYLTYISAVERCAYYTALNDYSCVSIDTSSCEGKEDTTSVEHYFDIMHEGLRHEKIMVRCQNIDDSCVLPEVYQNGRCQIPADDCSDSTRYNLSGNGLPPHIGCHGGCEYRIKSETITQDLYYATYEKSHQQCNNETENFEPSDIDGCTPSSFNVCPDNTGLPEGFLNHNDNGIAPDPNDPGCLVSMGNDILCTYAPKNCMNKNGRVTCAVPEGESDVCIFNGGSKVCLNSTVYETTETNSLVTNPDPNTEITTTTETTENNIVNDPPVSNVVTVRTVTTDPATGDVTTTITSETTNNDNTYNVDNSGTGTGTEQVLTEDLNRTGIDGELAKIDNQVGGVSDALDGHITDIGDIDYSDNFKSATLANDFNAFPSGACNDINLQLPNGINFTISCADTAHIRNILSYVVWVFVLIAVFNDLVTSGRRA